MHIKKNFIALDQNIFFTDKSKTIYFFSPKFKTEYFFSSKSKAKYFFTKKTSPPLVCEWPAPYFYNYLF